MWKYLIVIYTCTIQCLFIQAQSTTGITGKPDTSYTTYSAYNSTRKTHPDIKIVPEFKSPSVSEKRNIAYCKVGDRNLLLDVFYPKQKSKAARPAILIIHGGGWRSGNRTQHYPLAQRLAASGYVCFTPEYRLSTEALYPAAVHDLKSALRWIRAHAKEYTIDTNKIAALGFSAGGELAAFLGTTNNDPRFEEEDCNRNHSGTVQAIVDLDGTLSFVHPESGEGDDSRSTSAATYWFGYPKKENLDLWQDASPLTHVGKNTPPTLFINSSVARMHAGREDFRKVLDQYGIYSEVQSFPDAPHSFPLFEPWFEPTVHYTVSFLDKVFSNEKQKKYDFVVAKDGTGDFKTVQEAINAVPDFRKKETVIFIKNGVYKEKLVLAESKAMIKLIGESVDSTVLTYDDWAQKKNIFGEEKGTSGSAGFYIYGPDFSAENITFQNTAGPIGQAVAVLVAGDRAQFRNCKFLGFQDTLYTWGRESRQYYKHCYIEGTVDFIFGSSTAVFDSCTIFGKRRGFFTAASTPENKRFGYVFLNCHITGDATPASFYLGRPWRPFAKTVFLNCRMDKIVAPEGWNNWDNPANEKTAYYAEYKNYGEGAAANTRVPWSHQLTDEEAKQYTLQNIFNDWNPLQAMK
ncbi:MAG: alpha/beta hydrolase fold domain-containing protein [Flavisolibacter sp.]|nr:alpha/beta hydrolase fold domain-containing protein [Flavisolibacter sp.]